MVVWEPVPTTLDPDASVSWKYAAGPRHDTRTTGPGHVSTLTNPQVPSQRESIRPSTELAISNRSTSCPVDDGSDHGVTTRVGDNPPIIATWKLPRRGKDTCSYDLANHNRTSKRHR